VVARTMCCSGGDQLLGLGMVGQTVSLPGVPGDTSEPREVWSTGGVQFVRAQVCVRPPVLRGECVPRQTGTGEG